MFRKAELTPLSHFDRDMGNLELPDYVPIDRIGVNLPLVSKITGMACCQPTVKFDMYSGPTTEHDPGVAGTMDDGTAMAGLHAKKEDEVALAKHDFEGLDPYNRFLLLDKTSKRADPAMVHQIPQLHVAFNLAEMDNRLSLANAVRREPKPWVDLLNEGVRQAMGQAAKEHLLRGGGRTIYEIATGSVLTIVGAVATSVLGEFMFRVLPGSDGDFDTWGMLPATLLFARLIGEVLHKADVAKEGSLSHGVCYSLIPGYHLDRLLAAQLLLKNRRIFRVLPPGTVQNPITDPEGA